MNELIERLQDAAKKAKEAHDNEAYEFFTKIADEVDKNGQFKEYF